jgi:hypothetical protein
MKQILTRIRALFSRSPPPAAPPAPRPPRFRQVTCTFFRRPPARPEGERLLSASEWEATLREIRAGYPKGRRP